MRSFEPRAGRYTCMEPRRARDSYVIVLVVLSIVFAGAVVLRLLLLQG